MALVERIGVAYLSTQGSYGATVAYLGDRPLVGPVPAPRCEDLAYDNCDHIPIFRISQESTPRPRYQGPYSITQYIFLQ